MNFLESAKVSAITGFELPSESIPTSSTGYTPIDMPNSAISASLFSSHQQLLSIDPSLLIIPPFLPNLAVFYTSFLPFKHSDWINFSTNFANDASGDTLSQVHSASAVSDVIDPFRTAPPSTNCSKNNNIFVPTTTTALFSSDTYPAASYKQDVSAQSTKTSNKYATSQQSSQPNLSNTVEQSIGNLALDAQIRTNDSNITAKTSQLEVKLTADFHPNNKNLNICTNQADEESPVQADNAKEMERTSMTNYNSMPSFSNVTKPKKCYESIACKEVSRSCNTKKKNINNHKLAFELSKNNDAVVEKLLQPHGKTEEQINGKRTARKFERVNGTCLNDKWIGKLKDATESKNFENVDKRMCKRRLSSVNAQSSNIHICGWSSCDFFCDSQNTLYDHVIKAGAYY